MWGLSQGVDILMPDSNATVICTYDIAVVKLSHMIEGDLMTIIVLDL